MKSNKDYLKEENLDHIQELLKENNLDKLIDPDFESENEITAGDDIPEVIEDSFPGLLKFRIDAFKMNLFMDLKAPVNSSEEITILDIKAKIEEFGSFCEGFADWDKIKNIYTRVIFDGELLPEQIVATGKPVKFNVLEHIILKEGLDIDLTPHVINKNKVDFHHINSFIMIAKDEFLGNLIPELPGIDGQNLYGEEIKAPKKTINQLTVGKNIKIISGKLFSEIDGSFKIINNEITVDSILEIDTDIDYHTGDIDFSGDINIKKSIREGFNVRTSKSIFVEDSIEPSNIECGNNLNVKHGIIGSSTHEVHVKGNIDALHAENAIIKSNGNISIENGIINSVICCLDTLIVGDKGSIIGGKVNAQNGVIAGNIGNKLEIETRIHTGVDYQIEEKLHKIQVTSVNFIDEMNKLQSLVQKAQQREEKDKIKYLFLQVKSRLNSLNNYSRALLSRLDKNDHSSITVLGTVYPGVYIEICHVSYMVEKELSGVVFTLDKQHGCVKYSSL